MRLFGNAVQQYYGALTISAPVGGFTPLTLVGATASGQLLAAQSAAGINALAEFAGNGNVIGTSSLAVGQSSAGASTILARGAQSLAIGVNAGGQISISSTGGLTFAPTTGTGITVTDGNGSVWNGATGGNQGAGTINAVGLFVNGVAVATGTAAVIYTANKSNAQSTARSSNASQTIDPQLQVNVTVSGTYAFDLFVEATGAASNTGIILSLGGGSATVTRWNAVAAININTGGMTELSQDSSVGSTLSLNTSATSAGALRVKGVIVVSSAGTLGLSWSPFTNSSNMTLQNGTLIVTKTA